MDIEALLNSVEDNDASSQSTPGGSIVEAYLAGQQEDEATPAAPAAARAPPTDEEMLAELMREDPLDEEGDLEMEEHLTRLLRPGGEATSSLPASSAGRQEQPLQGGPSAPAPLSALAASADPLAAAALPQPTPAAAAAAAAAAVSPSARHAAAMAAEYTTDLAASGLGEPESEAGLEALLASIPDEDDEDGEGEGGAEGAGGGSARALTTHEEESRAHVLAEVEVELAAAAASRPDASATAPSAAAALEAATQAMSAAAAAGLPVPFPAALLRTPAAGSTPAPQPLAANALPSPARTPALSGSRGRGVFATPAPASDADQEMELDAIISAFSTPGAPPLQAAAASAPPDAPLASALPPALLPSASAGTDAQAEAFIRASAAALQRAAEREHQLLTAGNTRMVSPLAARRSGRPQLPLSRLLELRGRVSLLAAAAAAAAAAEASAGEAGQLQALHPGSARGSMSEEYAVGLNATMDRSRASSLASLEEDGGEVIGGGGGGAAARCPWEHRWRCSARRWPVRLTQSWARGPFSLQPSLGTWRMGARSPPPTAPMQRRRWCRPLCCSLGRGGRGRGRGRRTWTLHPLWAQCAGQRWACCRWRCWRRPPALVGGR